MLLTEGPFGYVLLAAVTFLAGAINSVAGGGTILTFPLLTAILPNTPSRMVLANVTSTLGLFPRAVASTWAYRREREDLPSWARWLFLPCLAGAIAGAGLLIVLPPEWFERLVPWLILSAAVLFAVQPQLSKLAVRGAAERPQSAIVRTAMLAKNLLAMLVNGMAAAMLATLALAGYSEVSFPHAALMAITGSCGSLSGSVLARRMPPKAVRRIVAAIGFGLAGYYFISG